METMRKWEGERELEGVSGDNYDLGRFSNQKRFCNDSAVKHVLFNHWSLWSILPVAIAWPVYHLTSALEGVSTMTWLLRLLASIDAAD